MKGMHLRVGLFGREALLMQLKMGQGPFLWIHIPTQDTLCALVNTQRLLGDETGLPLEKPK